MDKVEQKVLEYEVTTLSRESFMNTSLEGSVYGEGRSVTFRSDDERQPFTTMDTDDNLHRHIHIKKPRNPNCVLSRSCCVCLVILVVCLLLLIALLLILLLVKPCYSSTKGFYWCRNSAESEPAASQIKHASNDSLLTANILLASALSVSVSSSTVTPDSTWSLPTEAPNHPWSQIRLPRTTLPTRYSLSLRIDLSQLTFKGSVEIDLICSEMTSYVVLHSHELNIDHTKVSISNITESSFTILAIKQLFPVEENQYYVIETFRELQPGERYRLRFGDFRAPLRSDMRGLYYSSYVEAKNITRYMATSQLQSVDARTVFPCFDEPDLKANFSVTITHQSEYISLSNMPLRQTTRLAGGNWMTDQFMTTPLMSTYLLAFVVADLRHHQKTLDDGLKIRILSRPEMESQTQYALGFAGDAYTYFKDYFQIAEVVPKADHVAVPDFSAGAMENWGLVLYRETALLHDTEQSSIANKYWVSLIIAHEIAHSWFGNMVTMKWWDDLWLNEGFANTLMYFALDNIYPSWNVDDLQLVDNVYPVMTEDSLLTSHAISTPIQDPDDIPQFFDSISYDKGMAVLRLLRGFLGWDSFRDGLRMYIQRYKFSNAEMTQLWGVFSEAVDYKYDVSEIMDTWTRQMGFPVVTVTHVQGSTYHVTQERFLLNPNDTYDPDDSTYGYKWEIPFSYRLSSDDVKRTKWLHKTSANIQVPRGAWILGNVDYAGFYRTNYDETTWRRLTDQLYRDHTVFSVANRAGLISDAFNLARANLLDYKIALNLTSYLHKETDYVPWRAFLDSIHFIRGMLATSSSYGMLQRYIYDLVAPHFRRVGTSDQGDLLERNLRRLLLDAATSVGVPDAVDWAQRSFDSWMNYGTNIRPDYAVVIYSVGIHHGGETEWDYLWQKAHDTPVASQAEIMMRALAATQKPWLLWRFARWTLDSSKVRMQDVSKVFNYYAHSPLGRSVAFDFLLTNWDEINNRFGLDAFLIRDLIQATTSLVNTEFEYQQLRTLYSDRPPAGVASKAADNSLALIRSNIQWLKLNDHTISSWLEEHHKTKPTPS